ncbi:hypothetical protein BH11PAT4_BH11PAT4_7270 [soil metagenome]
MLLTFLLILYVLGLIPSAALSIFCWYLAPALECADHYDDDYDYDVPPCEDTPLWKYYVAPFIWPILLAKFFAGCAADSAKACNNAASFPA